MTLPKLPEPAAWMKRTTEWFDGVWDAYDFSVNQFGDFNMPLYTREQVEAIRKEAVEACARVCEQMDEASYPHTRKWPSDCAAAIRALKTEEVHLTERSGLPPTVERTWPVGLVDRIKAAEQRIQDNCAPRRIPADVNDVDLVLAEVRRLLEGEEPPFWLDKLPREPVPSRSQSGALKPNHPESESSGSINAIGRDASKENGNV